MTTPIEVIDKFGNRVRRSGIIEDGDRIATPMRMMDTAHPGFAAAAAVADAIKRAEAFDASRGVGHRPGYATQDAGDAAEAARKQRDARTADAWKAPPPVADQGQQPAKPPVTTSSNPSHDELITARDMRLEQAWRQ
jgi:hypothetical protein